MSNSQLRSIVERIEAIEAEIAERDQHDQLVSLYLNEIGA